MKFDYIKQPYSLDPHQSFISRPLVPVRLSVQAVRLETYALLGSGADRSLFHSKFAHELLLDLETGKQEIYYGIGGEGVPVYLHLIDLRLVGVADEIHVEVGFTDASGVDAILGQADFFQNFQIKFERYKERIEINSVKKH